MATSKEDIKEGMSDAANKAKGTANDAANSAKDAGRKAVDAVDDAADKAKTEGKSTVDNLKDKAAHIGEVAKEKGHDAASAVADGLKAASDKIKKNL